MGPLKSDWQPKSDQEMSIVVNESSSALPLLRDEELLKTKSQLFKALGDETRIRIIGILKIQESCLCELVAGLQIPSSTLTHHLQILERSGIIRSRKEKKFTLFSLVQNHNLDLYFELV